MKIQNDHNFPKPILSVKTTWPYFSLLDLFFINYIWPGNVYFIILCFQISSAADRYKLVYIKSLRGNLTDEEGAMDMFVKLNRMKQFTMPNSSEGAELHNGYDSFQLSMSAQIFIGKT